MKSALRAIEQQAATNDAMARWLTGILWPRNRRRYCLAIQLTQNATGCRSAIDQTVRAITTNATGWESR